MRQRGDDVNGPTARSHLLRRTKIVATLGPATRGRDQLREVIAAGVDVVRLNLSHGQLAEHLAMIREIRVVAGEIGRPIGILADLPGPKVRAGAFAAGSHHFVAGEWVCLRAGDGPSTTERVTLDYPDFAGDTEVGDRIVIGDGAITLRVRQVGPDSGSASHGDRDARDGDVWTVVETGGATQGRPGVHLRGDRLRLPTPTAHDEILADAVAAAGVEFVAVSFVRDHTDLQSLRAVVAGRSRVVAKIETAAALEDLGLIIAHSDAVMVARGDLGIDCPAEDVPHLQKRIIRSCVEAGVPVITATQMLESMISSPSPTRAEVSDVANAVFDGTDALMLSGETAIGRDPAAVVRTMGVIAQRAEVEADYRQWAERLGRIQRERSDIDTDRITAALAHAAARAAADLDVAAIICCTRSGRAARAMARFRPQSRLLGLSHDPHTLGSLTLSWGVEPLEMPACESTDEMVWLAVETAVRTGRVKAGDTVVVLAGAPDRSDGAAADVMRVVQVD